MTSLTVHTALEQHFGFREFLDGQEEAVQSIVNGNDTLIVMPTGGGKSLCYQLPALVMKGITIVVSPLIALMKDQVDGLQAKNIPATFINSSLSESEVERRIAAMMRYEYKLVYIAPERFKSPRFIQALEPVMIALFAIDEAHCISQWGHDFRPDYIKLAGVLTALGNPQVAALTATATPDVRDDIINQLSLGRNGRTEPSKLVSGFARPNLGFMVSRVNNGEEKLERIVNAVSTLGTGIVYCATRKKVESVARGLNDRGFTAVAYHGGMSDEARSSAQDAFMTRQAPVVVATNAFGMGVDRADVRFVIHYDIPGSVEAYYQEAGRAGRDGEPSWCELLYNYADVRTQEFFIEGANPTREIIEDVYRVIQGLCAREDIEMAVTKIAATVLATRNSMAVGSALNQLVRADAIEREYAPGSRTYTTRLVKPVKSFLELEIDYVHLQTKRRRDEAKLHKVIQYAEYGQCRQRYILDYFGDNEKKGSCGTCDYCIAKERGVIREPTDEERLVIKKALSGVARLDGRFGRGRISQVLTGSRAREVLDAGLDQLSTYAILSEQSGSYVWALLTALIDGGCIEVAMGEYPIISLTQLGWDVMNDKTTITLELPEQASQRGKKKGRIQAMEQDDNIDPDLILLNALREWRRAKAVENGVPAYRIYTNRTLEALAAHKPVKHIDLLNIAGIGPAKARQFGAETLKIITQFVEHGRAAHEV